MTYSRFQFCYQNMIDLKSNYWKTTTSDCGWSINGSRKWSANSNIHAFFGMNRHKQLFIGLKILSGILIALCILLSYFLLFIPSLLNNLFILILHDNNYLFAGKYGSSLQYLILNLPNKNLHHIYNTGNISHEDLFFFDQLHHSWISSH